MRFAYIVMMLAVIAVSGCSHKKIIVKECQKADNTDLYICSPL